MIAVEDREYARLLGLPEERLLVSEPARLGREAKAWYARYGTPRATTIPCGDGVAAAFTAGFEIDARVASLWEAGRVDEAYFLERLGAAVVEALALEKGRELGAAHRSPGTAGFPIEEQWTLMHRLAPLAPGVELLDSGALRPKHSLLALYVSGEPRANPCIRCDLRGCDYRRVA